MAVFGIITVIERKYSHSFAVRLDDDFKGAEKAIHAALRDDFSPLEALRTFSAALGRQRCTERASPDWYDAASSQKWTVEFTRDASIVRCQINGFDALNRHIFMRTADYSIAPIVPDSSNPLQAWFDACNEASWDEDTQINILENYIINKGLAGDFGFAALKMAKEEAAQCT